MEKERAKRKEEIEQPGRERKDAGEVVQEIVTDSALQPDQYVKRIEVPGGGE